MDWQMEATEQFLRDAKRYAKKLPGESEDAHFSDLLSRLLTFPGDGFGDLLTQCRAGWTAMLAFPRRFPA